MSEFKGTPGPWLVRKWNGNEWPDRRITVGPEADGIATAVCISPRYCDDEQMEADARLISAAPDLLEALKYARRFLSVKDHDTAYVDAAIAKALGKESTK